jgi:hypothetical protein
MYHTLNSIFLVLAGLFNNFDVALAKNYLYLTNLSIRFISFNSL